MDKRSMSEIVFRIVQSYRLAMRSSLNAGEIGLNAMHVRCLSLIDKSDVCTANDIVTALARDKAQIARLIKEMIERNWLTKVANPEDKRSQLLSLTEEGRALAKSIAETQIKVMKKMQENLTAAQLNEFSKTADLMAANLEKFNR
ncbi:MarR family transcriptional regulator [Simiduia curdlanivorans]|uniref:MarR family winged helix-turn-helix transcriptional regulator n=1 Tax=Simiduia curdlanivorans TaxID=1492769 RepID=A0ABV8UY99_9GAMM|nr:MarR family transcriptional regulator [Simiduia curdlanivorans]MDN3640295.1 MarR family transcriptional regulator [Simiduia curdlanivorans]